MTSDDEPNARLGAGSLVAAVVLAGWLTACDLWVKWVARAASCPRIDLELELAWTLPTHCTGVSLPGGGRLIPGVRPGALFGTLALPTGHEPLYGLGCLALATIVTILVVRWRRRTAGDALALGTLWAGVLPTALPRLLHLPGTFTELEIGPLRTSLTDFAIAWSLVWLASGVLGVFRRG